ncbi:MAG: protein kinase [Candidatus Aminicenantes bacterium]|nr:MAG: protein kinase [Candidatus Aminicenantes bacterium]
MIGKKIAHYKILEELGSGGMGVVYKAEDCKLKRIVALKFVVPRMLRKQEDKERFLREAQTAASLNHPHICTIYHIDEVEDSTFIVMEYIEGQSLKEIIQTGSLEFDKALDFAMQIAEGLEAAQGKNIVHRDIKSSNIMVTSKAQTKIMDFGLAKIVSESQLTETASIMGTVAYMSPEHASGDAIDHRSDIWSLGVVLYEMLSGQLPFQEDHEQLVLYSILNKFHKPVTSLRPSIPTAMERIVDKCLEKDPTERYQNADELLTDLRWLKKQTESGIIPRTKPTWKRRRAKKLRSLVIPGIFILMMAILISGYFLLDWFNPSVPYKTSIAVMPIEDLSPQKENEALCLASTRDIIRKISLLSDELRVVPYDEIMMHYRQGKTSISIGRELDVEFVLNPVLQSDANRLQIKAELISVKENNVRNSFGYEESEQDNISILDIQDQISKAIVSELGIHFAETGLLAAKKGEPQDDNAYKWYVNGMYIVDKQDTYPDVQEWFDSATRMFNNAISLDPEYALAYWGLGAANEAYYIETGRDEELERTIAHWDRAYELDPNLAETNLGSGWAHFYREDLGRAHLRFKRALVLNPTSPLVNCDVGSFLASIGLFYRAIDYFEICMRVDPGYLRSYVLNAKCRWFVGEFAEGGRILESALGFEKKDYYMRLEYANHLIMLGRYRDAEVELAEVENMKPGLSDLHRALLSAHRGEREKAVGFIQKTNNSHLYNATCVFSLLGMYDEAIENIKTGIEIGFEEDQRYLYSYLMLQKHPCYVMMHDDPRFVEIMKEEKEKYERRLQLYGYF